METLAYLFVVHPHLAQNLRPPTVPDPSTPDHHPLHHRRTLYAQPKDAETATTTIGTPE